MRMTQKDMYIDIKESVNLNVLVACEESQRVCMAFRERGHNAFSCDIQELSGDHPEWHIRGDVQRVLYPKWCIYCGKEFRGHMFYTMDGTPHGIRSTWDLIIAHPPCTYLSNVATRSHSIKCTPREKIIERTINRIEAMSFFMSFELCPCEHIAIENPVGVMNTCYRKPDQIIHPYMFADSINDKENYVTKATCLWLKGLPLLKGNDLPKPDNKRLFGVLPSGKSKTWEDSLCRSGGAEKARSKTFPGIARAMAEQWG